MWPALCAAQSFYRAATVGAAGQVEAAQALQSPYLSGQEQAGRLFQGGAAGQGLSPRLEPDGRAAGRAGIWLGVEAAV